MSLSSYQKEKPCAFSWRSECRRPRARRRPCWQNVRHDPRPETGDRAAARHTRVRGNALRSVTRSADSQEKREFSHRRSSWFPGCLVDAAAMTAPVLGLDLGNSTCAVAVYRSGTLDVVPNEQGSRMTPSIVAFTDVETLLGEAAKAHQELGPPPPPALAHREGTKAGNPEQTSDRVRPRLACPGADRLAAGRGFGPGAAAGRARRGRRAAR